MRLLTNLWTLARACVCLDCGAHAKVETLVKAKWYENQKSNRNKQSIKTPRNRTETMQSKDMLAGFLVRFCVSLQCPYTHTMHAWIECVFVTVALAQSTRHIAFHRFGYHHRRCHSYFVLHFIILITTGLHINRQCVVWIGRRLRCGCGQRVRPTYPQTHTHTHTHAWPHWSNRNKRKPDRFPSTKSHSFFPMYSRLGLAWLCHRPETELRKIECNEISFVKITIIVVYYEMVVEWTNAVFYGGMCVCMCVMQRATRVDRQQSAPVFLIFIAPMNNCRTAHCSFHGIDAFVLVSRFAQQLFQWLYFSHCLWCTYSAGPDWSVHSTIIITHSANVWADTVDSSCWLPAVCSMGAPNSRRMPFWHLFAVPIATFDFNRFSHSTIF